MILLTREVVKTPDNPIPSEVTRVIEEFDESLVMSSSKTFRIDYHQYVTYNTLMI